MADIPDDASVVKETDVVFDCPHCGKSLAIDYHGAGLTIACSDCGRDVTVPIPDGMDIRDIDNTAEDQEALILNFRRSLAVAEARIVELEDALADSQDRRRALEQERTRNNSRLSALREQAKVLGQRFQELGRPLDAIVEIAEE